MPSHYRKAWLSVALLVIGFYFWCAQSGQQKFVWDRDLNGYYDLLGRAFLGGKLHLPVEPRPELLALPNPWDATANRSYRLHDAVLYRGHYYLYHGATPALLLFAPWRLLTGHDLPENFAVFLLCSGGYLFLGELLILSLPSLPYRVSTGLFTLFLLVLGLGESTPFLLQRAVVYEVAIASGFFLLSGGFLFFFKTLVSSRHQSLWITLCSLFFGLAIGCRPHLGLAALPVFVLLLMHPGRSRLTWRSFFRKEILAYILPLAACCLILAIYNFARFGSPFEFGLRYQLGRPDYLNLHLSFINIPAGIYHLLLSAPVLEPVFPFFRLAARPCFSPERYFLEPIAGVVMLCPLVLRGLAAPLLLKSLRDKHPLSALLWTLYFYSVACVLFIAGLGLASERFEVDFEPYLLLIGCILTAVLLGSLQGFRRTCTKVAVVALVAYSILGNIAITIQGPYDQFVQAHPDLYTSIARYFSPVERFRPVLSPKVQVEGRFQFGKGCWLGEQPLLSLGEFGSRYVLSAECLPHGQLKLISGNPLWSDGVRAVELSFQQAGVNSAALEFTPEERTMSVRWNGRIVIRHLLRHLITAPSQVQFNEDSNFVNAPRLKTRIVNFRAPGSKSLSD